MIEMLKDELLLKALTSKIKNLQNSFVTNGFKLEIINDEWILSLSS